MSAIVICTACAYEDEFDHMPAARRARDLHRSEVGHERVHAFEPVDD